MGDKTNIAWCDKTWNPWTGCRQISPACKECYAKALVERFGGDFSKRIRTSEANWKKPYQWNRKAEMEIAPHPDYANHRPRVFSLSLGDWLDDEVNIEWLADMLRVIYDTPNLDWLLLTKRPENWRERVTEAYHFAGERRDDAGFMAWLSNWIGKHDVPSNVRIGITAENQKAYDERLIPFLSIPAYSRFISMEPLLENIDMNLEGVVAGKFQPVYMQVDQIIVGGESGPAHKERQLDLKAVANIYTQCRRWNVKFFMKQDSGPRPGMRGRIPDKLWVQEFPE
jgi:protein gp37